MDAVRFLVEMHHQYGIKAATTFLRVAKCRSTTSATTPSAKCVELDIPIFCCAGVPERVPMAPQSRDR
jgi:hypothetical protein